MKILHDKNKNNFIAYYKLSSSKKKAPYIIFHHGLMSDMNGSKSLHIHQYCKDNDYNFIRFDNFGHGKSSGQFIDQTITSWLHGLNLIINNLTENAPILLIGSSMGAWITMLSALNKKNKLLGMIGISSAPDFTEELIWNKLSQSDQLFLTKNGMIKITGDDPNCNHTYPIKDQLITDGRNHLLLNRDNIEISCPVHLIHGTQDEDVPYDISMRASNKIVSDKVVLKLIKNSNHSLSGADDLNIICNSIEEILSLQI